MRAEQIERVKVCRSDPKMKQSDVPTNGDPERLWMPAPYKDVRNPGQMRQDPGKPGFVHTDSGEIFASRSALKKAIRIAWSKPNPLRQANKNRLHRALNQIIRANDMSIPEMVRAEIKRNVDRSAEGGAIQSYLQQMIHAEVQKALGNRAQIEAKVKAYALEEAKRLVCEGLTMDFELAGSAYTRTPGSGRALRLTEEPE